MADAAAHAAASAPQPISDPVQVRLARSLTLRYLVVSTAFFGVAGAMGMVMRDSQAGLGHVSPTYFYAIMTAHGLGAFVGWAAFALMGLSWWVLAQVGFPLGRWGGILAEATFWSMVVGVLGVVVSTLGLKFGASWVFLYPLPFHGVGAWGDGTTALFAASVLLVGVSILTWCVGILVVVAGPALHAVRGASVFNRLGIALGLGFIAPKRFATNPRPVPYAVIPLTVIAIDMFIATIPLAILLVEMIIQSFSPGVTVDPLLAKNVLWFFGHPVVYLLLFPAVAIYYLLIPRFAGRALVAGNIISVGWTIAVIANVLVWAHHVYLDYPVGSIQAALDTSMQPMTYALTVVSALSLYSLAFTIFRSRFIWNAASIALFLGLVSWLLAGLSGVVNATIAFDQVVHNSLWIVGHFHQMALLNIGLVIFGALYAFLPDLLGRPLYSERLAKWHVWLTFFAGTAVTVVWLIQGLEGAPRRYSTLPTRYDDLSAAAMPFVWILALAQLILAWNLIQTLRGKQVPSESGRSLRHPVPMLGPKFRGAQLQGGLLVASVVVCFALGAGAWGIAHATSGTAAAAPSTPGNAALTAGKQVFMSAGCAGCHTLKAAGATGTVGPSLDQAKPSAALVVARVTNGRGAMPSFKGTLSAGQIREVAAFVSQSAGP